MVVETDLRRDMLDWLDAAFEVTNDLTVASIQVAERIVKEGYADAFVREFGPEVLDFWWRHRNAAQRSAAATSGNRRVDPQAVKQSLLEQIEKVGDKWARIGDCDQRMCRQLQRWYHRQGEGNLRKAFMFAKLADGLRGTKIVRDVFSDDQARMFLAEFRME